MDLAEVFSRLDRDFRDSKKNFQKKISKKNFQKKISKKNFQKKNSKFFLGLNPSAINLESACKQKMGGGLGPLVWEEIRPTVLVRYR
jgi:hypothetical protein